MLFKKSVNIDFLNRQMSKTKIMRRIRIRGQISNSGHLGRIPVEILERESRI